MSLKEFSKDKNCKSKSFGINLNISKKIKYQTAETYFEVVQS